MPLLQSLRALGSVLIVYEDGSVDATRAKLRTFVADHERASEPMDGTIRLILADGVDDFFGGDARRERKIALCRHTLLHEALHHTSRSGALATGGAFMLAVDLDCTAPHPPAINAAVAKMLPPWLRQGKSATDQATVVRDLHATAADLSAKPVVDGVPPHVLPASVPMMGSAWDTWDVLSAAPRGHGDYYDHSALRASLLGAWFTYDYWYDLRGIVSHGNCVEHHLRVSPMAPVLPVESAFNGLALYRLATLNLSGCGYVPYYRVRPNSTVQPVVVRGACEHVAFHLCLRAKQLTIGIDPSLQTGCWSGWRSKRPSPLVRVHIAANGSILRQLNPLAPKSTTRLSNGTAGMRKLRATLLARANTDALDATQRARDARQLWYGCTHDLRLRHHIKLCDDVQRSPAALLPARQDVD